MIRIAFVHNWFPAGGAERITLDIARYLHGIGGYEVYVYATKVDSNLMTDEMNSLVTIRLIPSQAVQSRRSKAVEELIVKDGINVLVQVTKALKGIDGISSRTGCKTIVACHGEPFWQRYAITFRRQKGFVRKLMWNLFNKYRYNDGTLAMSKAVARTRNEYMNCDAYTVLCGSYKQQLADELGIDAETSRIYPIENPEKYVKNVYWDKENVVLFCGRFENWSKRIDRLLRIWSKVQDKAPHWRLVLVGDGPDRPKLQQMAEELSLKRVSFEGMQADVRKYYDKASIVAMTSQTEGWPLALSEAQAHGCIGVAFGCSSGVSEILGPDGECGFIVPAFDERRYADALLEIMAMSQEDKMRVRRNAVEKRRKYTPEIIAQKWKSLFDGLVNQ